MAASALVVGPIGDRPARAGQPSAVAPELAARLLQPARLGTDDLGALLAQAAGAVEGRPFRATDGTATALVDDDARAVLLMILTGGLPIEDVGLRTLPGGPVRGLRSPATAPRSEIGAKQTLWIDVRSFLPRRYEFAYEVPGMGDLAYDLIFD